MSGRRARVRTIHDNPAAHGGRARGLVPAILAALLALAALGAWPGAAAADDRPTLVVDPATQTVAPGQTFPVNVVQDAAVTTTGAQASVVFDAALIQLQDFELGEAYTGANAVFAFGIADLGTSTDKAAAIARANKFGVLENVAGFLLPGSGTIPPGPTLFLKLTFAASEGEGGALKLNLLQGAMIDEQGAPLDPRLVRGAVTVSPGAVPASAAPGESASPGASSEPASSSASPVPSPAASEAPIPPVNPTTPVTLSVAPTSLTLKAGNTARVFLISRADGNITSAAADLTFDKDKLEVVEVVVGPGWDGAVAIAVATDKTSSGMDAAIAEANTTGKLQQAGAFFIPGTPDLPNGETVFSMVLVKARADGTFNLSIDNAGALGIAGEDLESVVDPGSLTPAPPKPIELDLTLVVPVVLLLVALVVGTVLVRTGRIPVRVRRRWPYYLSLLLGLIPVVLFTLMVALLLANAVPALTDPGIGALFGGTFTDAAGRVQTGYSLVEPVWGTILTTAIAVAVALPISLALAVVAVDYPMGPIGRLIRPVISILSGVPPIVYAVSVPAFILLFMIPKFAGNMTFDTFDPAVIGADPSTWPPADVPFSPGGFPWSTIDPNSTLLGGLLVGLFLIPFVTPQFVDALADVPRAAREGSLALGANRTYTLRRVVLPRAMPALAGAATLGVLKAMGDAVIVVFAIGLSGTMPLPAIDVLERSAPLGAWGSRLIGTFEVLDASCTPQGCAVGYLTALLLMAVAAVVVLVMSYVQARGRRRVAV